MAYLRFANNLFQIIGEVGDDHNGYGPGITELVFHLTRCIQRVCVHYDQARAERAEEGNGKL
jgi:hypothetical protein